MRGIAITLALVLALPLVSAFAASAPRSPVAAPAAGIAPLPADLRDGDLVRLLAAYQGYHVKVPKLALPADESLATLATKLGARAGGTVPPEDAARFAALDARVQAPAFAMLAAVDQAWDLRDQAFAKLSREDLITLRDSDPQHMTPHELELAANIDKEPLFAAAILLLDTMDGTVTPLVNQAVAAGVWPATPTADSVGVLRIGGTGNDVETVNRIVQIDPSGDDTYYNNAGGTTILNDLDPRTFDFPVGMSFDFGGSDVYRGPSQSFGGAAFGIGILFDANGNDRYSCEHDCLGSARFGIGLTRDAAGNDSYAAGQYGIGSSDVLGVLRDDSGSDSYTSIAFGGGFGYDAGLGLLWDRGGRDDFLTSSERDTWNYGFADFGGGFGWFAHEGAALDNYSTASSPFDYDHGCNDCEWHFDMTSFPFHAHGRGVDNGGGLAHLLALAPDSPLE